MIIRKLEDCDISEVVQLWYESSVLAHGFISAEYWNKNKAAMATEYLPGSETYLACSGNCIVGFTALMDNYLAAIFVKSDMQRQGLGKKLLDFVKETRDEIVLKVFSKNTASTAFYLSQGFEIIAEANDDATGEDELIMQWRAV